MALLHMLRPRRRLKQNPVLVLDCLEERCVLSNVLGSFADAVVAAVPADRQSPVVQDVAREGNISVVDSAVTDPAGKLIAVSPPYGDRVAVIGDNAGHSETFNEAVRTGQATVLRGPDNTRGGTVTSAWWFKMTSVALIPSMDGKTADAVIQGEGQNVVVTTGSGTRTVCGAFTIQITGIPANIPQVVTPPASTPTNEVTVNPTDTNTSTVTANPTNVASPTNNVAVNPTAEASANPTSTATANPEATATQVATANPTNTVTGPTTTVSPRIDASSTTTVNPTTTASSESASSVTVTSPTVTLNNRPTTTVNTPVTPTTNVNVTSPPVENSQTTTVNVSPPQVTVNVAPPVVTVNVPAPQVTYVFITAPAPVTPAPQPQRIDVVAACHKVVHIIVQPGQRLPFNAIRLLQTKPYQGLKVLADAGLSFSIGTSGPVRGTFRAFVTLHVPVMRLRHA